MVKTELKTAPKDIIITVKNTAGVRAEVVKATATILRRANATLTQRQNYPDYDMGIAKKGAMGTIYTRSNHAKYSNAKHNTLLRVLGGGGA